MPGRKKKVAILSNITVDLLAAKLRRKYEFYMPEGFDTWIQEVINPQAGLYTTGVDAVVVLLDGTEARAWKDQAEAEDRITLWKQALTALVDQIEHIPVFVSTIDLRENRIKSFAERRYSMALENEWYQFIQKKAEEKRNVYVLDIADLIRDIGRRQFYSDKMWYMSSMPYSRDGLNALAAAIEEAMNAAFAMRRKIIALDLDNTLWGGVIGEDGIEGVELSDHKEGQRYYDFQRQFLEMKKRGTVLALISKNNPEDVAEMFQKHPAMLLHAEDFVGSRINWKDKAANLKELENELNLTEGSFVFVDDNPAERGLIISECPEVAVPEFPTDTSGLLDFAEKIWSSYCRPLRVLEDDKSKTEMYRAETQRRRERQQSLNLGDYLKKLEMSVDIHRMLPEETDRVVQLCNKTNQFNVTTKRYTRKEIEDIAENEKNAVFVVHSADKYADNGLISVVILKDAGEDLIIDTFLMSCRVMGRRLEEAIIDRLAEAFSHKRCLLGQYLPTAKNAPVKDLYERLGFTVQSQEENGTSYALKLSGYTKRDLGFFKDIKFSN